MHRKSDVLKRARCEPALLISRQNTKNVLERDINALYRQRAR